MEFLPIFTQLNGRRCLIVGGGKLASRKCRLFLRAGAELTLVADTLTPELAKLAQQGQVHWCQEPFNAELLDGQLLVVAASGQRELDAQVYQAANRRGMLVHVAEDSRRSSFILPAVVDRSPILIAISSAGRAPELVRLLHSRLEASVPRSVGQLAQLAGRWRERLRERLTGWQSRLGFWQQLLHGTPLPEAGSEAEQAFMESQLSRWQQQGDTLGTVALVGAGPGDPELLTLKALQLLQQADVVVHDRLVSAEIMALVGEQCELIAVGKQAGNHCVPQEQINRLLLELARSGKRVVRLKGGDPFIFGRGAEELELLVEHQIPFQVVPGITAASGCTTYAGIPLTHRDHAQSVVFVTGHTQKNGQAPDWASLSRPNQTLVIYMGRLAVTEIQQQLLQHGQPTGLPVAIIEKGTTAAQRVWCGTLQQLPALAAQAGSPALIVVGEVVRLADTLSWFEGGANEHFERERALLNLA